MELPKAGKGSLGLNASPTLEETFFPFVLRRQASYSAETGPLAAEEEEQGGWGEREDLRRALRQREKDLHLAAELGKALLERNEELGRQKELLEQEVAHKLERLEQEKHEQQWKLEARASEWEARVAELESDLASLSGERARRRRGQEEAEAARARAGRELAEENQRLAEELGESNKERRQLCSELQALRDAEQRRSLVSTERVRELQSVRAENEKLVETRWDSDQRIKILREENVVLQSGVETLQRSLQLLQEHSEKQGLQLRQVQSELHRTETANGQLRNRVRELTDETCLHEAGEINNSLLSEIEHIIQGSRVTESLGKSACFRANRSSPDDLCSTSEELRSLGEDNRQSEASLNDREEQIRRLKEQVRLQGVELAALREEVESLRELSLAGDPDQALQQAISSRDRAIM
ncbi:BICD family-like cargo adapter 2, partial [Heterodontus francisci]|uniref:BICD family-like cargo adapter 2 n=1 Tax=Heterodontus francisci TaxID=7792 RepID=UPI00355B73F0